MRWLLIHTVLLIAACSFNYHDERSNPDTGYIYRIDTEHAHSVVEEVLIKSKKEGELDSFEPASTGYLFRIKKIESKVVLRSVLEDDGAYLGVAVDIAGSGDYLSRKMAPKEFQQTMVLIEKIRAELERASSGVIRRDAKQVIEGVYP